MADWANDFNWGGENLDNSSNLLDDLDLDTLLSSLGTPSSSDSTASGGSDSSPSGSTDHDDFQMTDILGYVLDSEPSQDGGSDALGDHDYLARTTDETTSPDAQVVDQSPPQTMQLEHTSVVQDLAADLLQDVVMGEDIVEEEEEEVQTEEDTHSSEELSAHSEQESVEEEEEVEEQVEEVVVQTVKVPQTRLQSTRKYITILPAQSKTQIALATAGRPVTAKPATVQQLTGSPAPKRRRILQDNKLVKAYPKLVLTPEEQQLCQKDGIVLPEYYPLTKSEESDLRKIRRKIRNKISAQKSRGRKKEYVDDMETRAKLSETENKQLKKKVAVLESQNRTLIDQLQRMRALLASSSSSKNGHKSTALMVLLLSTALFAVPGFKEQYGGGKTELGTPETASPSSADHFTPVLRRPASRSLLSYIGKGELGDTYPNIGNSEVLGQQSARHDQTAGHSPPDTPPPPPFDREKALRELTESLNFSREHLNRIRSGQEQVSTNRTRVTSSVPRVKSYDSNSI